MDNTFSIVDGDGAVLTNPDGLALTFRGANGWSQARAAAAPKYRRGKLVSGATLATDKTQPHGGPVYIEAEKPLAPSGESMWELTRDGSTYPVNPETLERLEPAKK